MPFKFPDIRRNGPSVDRKPADVVFLKFAKAFYSYHGFLLAKFESFGLHGVFLCTLSFVELYKKVLYTTV